MIQRALLMVGLPESGKSTYLGALFHRLRRFDDNGLRLARDPDELDYLLELERRWLALSPLERSRHHGAKSVELPIQDDTHGEELVLNIPDVVGEDYESAWEHGGWGEGLPDAIAATEGVLLFVRADSVREATPITVARSLDGGDADASSVSRWDPRRSPTQAKLCDILEQLSETRRSNTPPIAVVIAAWDAVAAVGLEPASWLEWQLPLLWQWLSSNDHGADAVFGVSAQGGDLRREEVRQELAKRVEDRPLPPYASSLTQPLRWFLDHER
jgi:hypothetical protein